MVEPAFDILLEVGVNTDVSAEIPPVASSMEDHMYRRFDPEDVTYGRKGNIGSPLKIPRKAAVFDPRT